MAVYGVDAIVRLTSHLIFVYFTFWAVQSVRTDGIFMKGKPTQIKVFFILFATAIGYLASSFFLECLTLIRNFILSVV